MEYQRDLKKMIEQYNNELMRAYQKRHLDADTTTTSSQPDTQRAEQAVATVEPQQVEQTAATVSDEIADDEDQIVETSSDSMAYELPDSMVYGVPDRMAEVPVVEEDVPVVAEFFAPGVPRRPVDFLELEQTASYHDDILLQVGPSCSGTHTPTAGAPMQTEPPSNQARDDQEQIGIGYAQIWVTTRDAIPIPGAQVVISSATRGGEVLQYSAMTNVDGLTPIFPLSAVADSETKATIQDNEDEDDMARPYTMYHVSVDAPGYYRLLHQDLPVYAGIKRVQPAEMTPEQERPVWKTPQSEPMSLE